ncbi:unnamed protein product, partial [Prunus brigantina]
CSSCSLTEILSSCESGLSEEENGEEGNFGELKAPFPQLFQWETPILSFYFFLLSFLLPWLDLMNESKWIYMLVRRVLLAACTLISFGFLNVFA